MSQKYLLPCSCGKEVLIETSQAGGNVLCECERSLKIPTLLQMKRLPLAEEAQTQSPSVLDSPVAASAQKSTGGTVNPGIFRIGSVLTNAAILYCAYTVFLTFPQPQDVLNKQVVYHFDGKLAVQDSTPIPMGESYFFIITDEIIDHFNPIDSMRYWELIKDGPAMSMNFRENYETLKDYYYLRCVGTGILVILALSILISSFFLGQTKTVGTRQGTVWK